MPVEIDIEESQSVKESAKPERKGKRDATRKQIRGSSLLLLGKLLSMGINFGSQVLIVRYLSTADYGAWAYALSVVSFFQNIAVFGLDRGITRFIPIYHEKNEYNKLFGTLILVFGSILLACALIIAAFYLAPEQIARLVKDKDQPLTLLFIMIFLIPSEAMDLLLTGLFASFTNPRAIFFRKHILGPSLRLGVVLLLMMLHSSVTFLAYGYIGASALGVFIYSWLLFRMMQREGFFQHLQLKAIVIPAKEIFAFTLPLLSSDLVNILTHSADTLLLGYFHDPTQVALYRVVLPAAHFNKLIMTSFGFLFTPLAARLLARNDLKAINDLYWRTAIWMGVLSFPIFALTFSMAKPLTQFLYGARYLDSWVFLQLISFGYYFSAALGFNGLTLKVLGKLRYIVTINILAVVVNVGVNLVLIPKYGALGAAIGTSSTMVVHNIFKQIGLRLTSGISIFDRQYLPFYLIIAGSAVALFIVTLFFAENIYVAVPLVALASLFILRMCRDKLKVEETFPELLKLPFAKKLLT
jgi:O-antigen/teichoic acid export membrane protein